MTNQENNQKNKKRSNRNKNTDNRKINIWRLSLILFLIMVFLGGGTVAGVTYSYIKNATPINMDNFVYMEPSVIVDINGDFYQELQGKEKRDVVSIDKIPVMVQNAFISVEDERFKKHNGVDILGIGQAALQGIKAGDLTTAGGSTITQQLIKLTHLSPEQSLKRKVQEAYLAIKLERNMTKNQILEAYLNKINFAYAHGIQAASQTYFRKNVEELTFAQAAVLAAIPKSPTAYKPYLIEEKENGSFGLAYEEDGKTLQYSEKNKNRAITVLSKMKELGHIEDKDYKEAKEQLENNQFGLVEPEDPPVYSYFTDTVFEQVVNDLMTQYNYDKEEATSYLINSGLKINATIDPIVQKAMDNNFDKDSLFPSQSSVAKRASDAKSKETGTNINYTPEGAMVMIDNRTGYVSGIVGGRNKEKSRSLNRALQKFQPGSSTKPLTVYAPGIDDKKITLASTYDDVPIGVGKFKPGNAGGGHGGMTTVRKGLFKSINTIAVQAWYDVGLETSVNYGEKFGLEFVKEGESNDMGPSPLALGGYTRGQTPLAMASAFSAFPNQGVRNEPSFYTNVVDKNGKVILEKKPDKTQVISPQTSYLMNDVLKDVPRGGTTTLSVPRMQIAGKTGTTNDKMHAWFVGYTPYYTASVWYGYDENKVKANGKTYALNIGVYGGSKPGPAAMWQSVMRDIHKDLKSGNLPGNPGGIVSAQVDSVSGLLPTDLTAKDPRGSTVISEMFIRGTVPNENDDYHVELEIDLLTNKIATENCPAHFVSSKVFIQKQDDRFPGAVKPINPNYIPKSEQNVIAPSEDDICELHGPNSTDELSISSPKDTIEVNEEIKLSVKGNPYGDERISQIEFFSDNPFVQVLDKHSGIIKGIKPGKAKITAIVTFKYKAFEGEKEVEKEINRNITTTITVKEPEMAEINLSISKELQGENQYKVIFNPSMNGYNGNFEISLKPNKININNSATNLIMKAGSSKAIDIQITGNNASLLAHVKAKNQTKKFNIVDFIYSKPEQNNENKPEDNSNNSN